MSQGDIVTLIIIIIAIPSVGFLWIKKAFSLYNAQFRVCPGCQNPYGEKQKACSNCGLQVAGPCPNCHEKVDAKGVEKGVLCPHCRHDLTQQGTTSNPYPDTIQAIVIREENQQ